MIKRIVKLTFRPEETDAFIRIFDRSQARILAFPGCSHLELWRVTDDPDTFFTYSHWAGPDDLEAYRTSEFFRKTWQETKALFADKPQAWSVEMV